MNWKEIVQNIAKHSDPIRKTTRPLRDHFGIGYFTYHKIDTQGNYTVLVDRPDWAEHYVSEQLYLNDPYLRHPSVYQSGITLFNAHGSEEYKAAVTKAGKEMLGMDTSSIIINKQASFVEFFGFAANSQTSSLNSLHLNSPHILHSFASHFKSQLSPILKKAVPGKLIDLKGNHFFYPELIQPNLQNTLAFYQDLGLIPHSASTLTSREKECLKRLTEDKSAKEIALALQLSHRTVEFYLENIKNKLDCTNKQELLKIARLLQ